ncbi:MAG: ATP-binding protein [Actinomycetota bacterium]|nr:ATP-binding protein [Actinomycetota bacterium]
MTAAAVVVVAAALLAGGLLLVVLLQRSLLASAEGDALDEAAEVATQLATQLAAGGIGKASDSITTAHAGQYVQIVDPAGHVVAFSAPSARAAPLSSLRPGAGRTLTETVTNLPTLGSNDDFFIVVTGVRTGGAVYSVQVAATVQVQADTVATVAWFALGASPLLLAIVGGAVWVLAGRSLRQVERIRGQVARINARRLDDRVDVPHTRDEIHALAVTMNIMLDRLQVSDRGQRRFVSDASHELRSPLATLSAGVEIASTDPTGETWKQLQDVLVGETNRMRYLVDDLLTLAQANDDGIRIASEDVDLDDVVDAEVRRLRSTSLHRITAELSAARIVGDSRRLAQVLRNVLDNADRHALSHVHVRLAADASSTIIEIDDDGAPVPEADRQRIFERFVRLDESRSRESGGSGLGLAIAAGILAAHHGSIRATQSRAGECRFEICFPAGPNHAPAEL